MSRCVMGRAISSSCTSIHRRSIRILARLRFQAMTSIGPAALLQSQSLLEAGSAICYFQVEENRDESDRGVVCHHLDRPRPGECDESAACAPRWNARDLWAAQES